MAGDELYSMRTRTGSFLAVQCPPWCTQQHDGDQHADSIWHEAPAIAFVGPGDYLGYADDGQPYEVMWACISAQPNDEDGTYGRPYLFFDTLGAGTGARLDVDQADAVLRHLRQYTDRLQQMRDQLARIVKAEGEK